LGGPCTTWSTVGTSSVTARPQNIPHPAANIVARGRAAANSRAADTNSSSNASGTKRASPHQRAISPPPNKRPTTSVMMRSGFMIVVQKVTASA